MSSSSRSIAAARQKRAGEQSQPMNNSRPVTSISSQGAFAQQYQQQMMSQSIPVGSKNVRVAQNRNQVQGARGANQNIQRQQQEQQEQSTKISVSNAIGLITLRLGKLEKMITEVSEDGGFSNNENNDHAMSSIPANMKLVTDEVFENIVNRLNLLESKVINNQTEMSDIKNTLDKFSSLLSSFINETNDKFIDYENALTEIENNFVGENNANIMNDENNEHIETAEKYEDTLENIESNNNDENLDNQ